MNFFRHTAFLFFGILCSCSPEPQVYTDADISQDFTKYSSFAWISDSPLIADGEYAIPPLTERRMTSAVLSAIEAKGYTFTNERANADFLVSFTMGARDQLDIRYYPDLFAETRSNWSRGGPYFGSIRTPFGFPEDRTQAVNYTSGTLSIDIFDVERRTPVWHARASKRLSQRELNNPSDAQFIEATTNLMANFPRRQ